MESIFTNIRQWWFFWLLFPFVFGVLIKFFSPPGMKTKKPVSKPGSAKLKYWSFVAMRYYALILNRTYRVLVTPDYICGIVTNGAIASPGISRGKEVGGWVDPNFYSDVETENAYKIGSVMTPAFLKKDKSNFRIAKRDIDKIDYFKKKWGMGTVPYSGRIVITTKDGKRMELILLGKQDHGEIVGKLSVVGG